MAKIHGKDKEFSCHICPKKFVYNYQLKTHLLTHSQSKAKLKGAQQNIVHQEETGNETALVINMDSGVIEEAENTNVDPYVQTLYQCSLCQHVFQTYKALQTHCAEHSQQDVTQSKLANPNIELDRSMDITVMAQNDIANEVNLDSINDGSGKNQLVLEISSEGSTNKPESRVRSEVSLPLDSLEGTIIKEQDGQQYYVVYDVPASQSMIEFQK